MRFLRQISASVAVILGCATAEEQLLSVSSTDECTSTNEICTAATPNNRSHPPSITPDPNLHPMTLPDGSVFYAYKTPPVSTMYPNNIYPPHMKPKTPSLKGIAGRFTNMCPKRKILVWIPENNPKNPAVIAAVDAFDSAGTATFFSHMFCFADPSDITTCESEVFTVEPNVARYVYNPYEKPNNPYGSPDDLSEDLRKLYDILVKDMAFSKIYKEFTGRDYLSRYPRKIPTHYMYPADYIGQVHTVQSNETHFVDLPPEAELKRVRATRKLSPEESPVLSQYRTPEQDTLNMTVRVMSCAPRVYMIDNFLSQAEVDHFLHLATGQKLSRSTTSGNFADTTTGDNGVADTRTSENTWVYRHHSPIIDSIYRRAADLLHIDEALMRQRAADEIPEWPSKRSISEALQVVHYDVGQEYTAHHDFAYPPTKDDLQSSRFATLLLYLNDDMVGGETAFPRWVNAQTSAPLKVKPKVGQAALFYSFLPDGNMDDLSQHASIPVRKGEKWLTNLWVWDPVYER